MAEKPETARILEAKVVEQEKLEPAAKQPDFKREIKDQQQVAQEIKSQNSRADVTNLGFPEAKISEALPVDYLLVPGEGAKAVGVHLHLDVAPQNYKAESDEKLLSIASKHLGEGAAQSDIDSHLLEIVQLNHLKVEDGVAVSDFKVKAGESLILPGHTKDGAITYEQSGKKFSYAEEGPLTLTRADGSGYVRKSGEQGDKIVISEAHFGPKPTDRFESIYSSDGNFLSTTRKDRAEFTPTKALAEERSHLLDLADRRVALPEEKEKFSRNIRQFEARAKAEGLSEGEVARTFHDLASILALKGHEPLSGRERVRLVTEAIDHAASPRTISQGDYETCQSTVLEERMFSKEPARVTALFAQIAEKGEFTSFDGTRVTMETLNLRAHGEAALNKERGSWTRTYASQVFQTAAINTAYTRTNERDVPPKDIRYLQSEHTEMVAPPQSDRIKPSQSQVLTPNGEKLMDYSQNPPKLIGEMPTTGNTVQMRGLYQQLTGQDRPDLVLVPKDLADYQENFKGGSSFAAKEDLGNYLAALRKTEQGDIYASLVVHANSDTLLPTRRRYPLVGSASPGKIENDLHVVNVIDYDAKTQLAKVEGSWGSARNFIEKPLTLEQLYNATQQVPGATWMDRLEAIKPTIKADDFDKQLNATTEAMILRWASRAQKGMDMDLPADDIAKTLSRYKELRAGRSGEILKDSDELVLQFEEALKQQKLQSPN